MDLEQRPAEVAECQLDILMNRLGRKWTNRELVGRAMWDAVSPLFSLSPRRLWGWRCWLLRLFGASVGKGVHISPSAKIFIPWNLTIGDHSSIGFESLIYNLGPITIGQRVTISQRAHLCGGSHDCRDATMPLLKLPITIGDDAWVCADAFVGPSVTVGEGAVVGARAAVFKDVAPWTIVGGNPAKQISIREMKTE